MAAPVALVTGASSGIGLFTSIELARNGFQVWASMREPSRSADLLEAARQAGVQVKTVRLDVTDPASIDSAVRGVLAADGRLDVLVNNAGFAMDGFFEDLSEEELRSQFETNFFGLAAVTRAVLPTLRGQRSGRVINVSSISGRFAGPGYSAYCSSKWAVEGLSESLRYELRPFGVSVCIIEPGGFYKTAILTRNRKLAARALDPASPYYALTQRMEADVALWLESMGGDLSEVASTIRHAALSPSPRLRYVIGRSARMKILRRTLLPDWLNEPSTRVGLLARLFSRKSS
ncbi:SDR family NAD(P)-dependent oxidoreductase [Pyxidicoccus sp. MSG2]|uniref:SDR family NAD(P)-dependent oxidoreductase n=1 Tax=Pyxidicoccus sp. MSG2 TaxID=2996790 RepID=UPI00226D91F2|nr:SDR family NAD(P)-dependent oxidoreductase [Pyxidicoccus sp. MSG2]MCY1021706.1 SDR family NAD(P)-dependent oxidoreductase [Pyxidicoccus sp. MSG2]